MAYRDRDTRNKSGNFDYCLMEVRLRKKKAPAGTHDACRVMIVDSHYDTLTFVQENMERCVGNLVKLRRLEEHQAKGMEESAALFQKSLAPLVSSLEAQGEGVMEKLSASLKKALLLMVITRYQSDWNQACQVLGITREKLESELKLCGVSL